MFFHRRKFLRSELLSAFKGKLDKPAVDEILGALGLNSNCRAEELDVDAMLGLCEVVRRRVNQP
jgi:16S rRNA (adenine1518-N6/adenine1519-N6)-dimethyltransferase